MNSLIEIKNITKRYGTHLVLDQVSFNIDKGETVGLVGASGSGKSTLTKVLLGLEAADSGSILFKNIDLTKLSPKEWMPFRKNIQIVFQNPYTSLNPRMKVEDLISEGLLIHQINVQKEVLRLLDLVALPKDSLGRYPHEFSGGQRQRIGIARALALKPELLILDEPTSALDVSIQAQVINLLKEIQMEMGLTLLFISHDLPLIHYLANQIVLLTSPSH